MSERAAYSRVYWSIVDDPKFATIYDDDRHLATWLRLLLIADQAHPASAPIPANCRKVSIAALADAGLIDLGAGHRFRVHGLDVERERRRLAATSRGASRDHSVTTRGPNGIQTRDVRRDENETRRDETTRATDWDDGRVDLETFLLLMHRAPTPRQRQLLDTLMDRHDQTGPAWAADIMLRHPDDPIGAVIEADREYRAQRIADAQKAERPKPIPRRKAGLPQSTREILAEMQRIDAEKAKATA